MYIPLLVKTDYSILSSLVKVKELVKKIKDLGYNSVGIIDDNLFYSIEFYKECINNNIKPIIGLNIKIEENDVYLYAKSYKGYQNLCYISSNDISIEMVKSNSSDLLCILPSKSLSLYDKLNIPDTYILNDENIALNNYKVLNQNIVRCLETKEIEYLKYLTLIKENKTIDDEIEEYADPCLKKMDDINITNLEKNYYEEIYNLCNVEIIKNDLLPKYNYDKNFDEKKYLEELCKKGLSKRLNNNVPKKYVDRLFKELDIINRMGFSNYFLVVWDYVKFAKKNGILVGPGRGSAVGSLVSYSLGITEIDPLKYDLLFERFLNPERVSMPDIDIDFDADKRKNVINYVTDKYGDKKVAGIITYGTLKAKSVLRDVARIFNMEVKIDSFIKLFDSKLTLQDNMNNRNIMDIIKNDPLISRICKISIFLEGLKRNTSIHAAGVIISKEDLDRYIPIQKNNDGNVAGFTMEYLEELGLLKMDFLALDHLTLISNLLHDIGDVDLRNIPLDDEKTLDIFRKSKTEGIFQFEKPGMKNVLRKFKVKNFNDIVAIIALFRPGPMDNIDTYIRRMEGKEKVNYIHDNLKPILESTYGIIIYQEQIIQIANVMAGFSLGQADILRKAMSKKKDELMLEQKEKFITGSIKNGYTKEDAEKVFNYIYKFASYGFNKAHSVGYALVAYEEAYIKANYMNYYMKYLLTMVIGNESKTKEYINECKLNKINIKKPDINYSLNEYIVENGSIIFPLSAIKNIGNVICKKILDERKNGEYKDFVDFVTRVYKLDINKKTISLLITAGVFDSFGITRKTLMNNLDLIINYADLVKDLDDSLVEKPELEIYNEYTKEDLVKQEFDSYGFYLSNHPVQKFRQNSITTAGIKEYFNKIIDIYLMVDNKREIVTKKNEKMLFLTGSDEFGSIELVVFPKTYERFYNITRGDVLKFNAKVERRGSEYQLIVNNIEKI